MAELLCSASCLAASLPMAGCVLSAPTSYHPPFLEVNLPCLPKSRPTSLGVAPSPMMGGGPRTFPGGVTKWQWKRMQQKKTTQILKARLLRERQIYEARRRAELMAATPELEMPWQKMSRVRPPNYVAADEHIKKLAGRFQKHGAEDLWTERDGPETFETDDGLSSPFFSSSNESSSPTMHDGVDSLAISDSDDRTAFWEGTFGRAIGGKSQDEFVSKSEGFSPRKFKPISTAKRDAAHSRGPKSTEDTFRPWSSVSVSPPRRDMGSNWPKREANKDGKENIRTGSGKDFVGRYSEDYSKSRTDSVEDFYGKYSEDYSKSRTDRDWSNLGISKDGTEIIGTDSGEDFFGKYSEDYSKSRTDSVEDFWGEHSEDYSKSRTDRGRSKWKNSMDSHTHN